MLLLVYHALHDQAAEYMRYAPGKNQCWNSAIHSLQLVVPRSRLKGFGDHAFSIAAPRLRNALPGSLTYCTKGIQTQLFKYAF